MRAFTTVLIATLATLILTGGCSRTLPELEPLITPDTSSLESVVQIQLAQARRSLETTTAVTDNPGINAQLYGQLGRLYLAYGLMDAAEPALVNAARLKPGEYAWHYLLGHLYYSRDTEQAAAHLRRALDIRSQDLPALVTLGLLELDRGHAETAQRLGERILDSAPDSAAGYYVSGRAALLTSDYETAVVRLQKALELEPNADRTYHPLAQAYRALGRTSEAAAAQQRAGSREVSIKDDLYGGLGELRRGARADIERGREALGQGQPDVALTWVQKAVDADPENALGWLLLGTTLGELGQFRAARVAFQEVLELIPDHPEALLSIGATYAREGNDAEAIAWYQRAIARDPGVDGGYLNLANAMERSGRCDEALPLYEKAWLQDQADPRPRLGAARCLTAVGYHAQALRSLEAGVAALPAEPALRHALARYLLTAPATALRDPVRALGAAEETVAMSRHSATLATLALAQASTGDFTAAVQTQRAAIAAAETESADDTQHDRLTRDLVNYEAGVLPQGL